MSTKQDTTTRRTITFSGLLLSLATAVLFGTALVPGVDAKTKTKVPINERVHSQIHDCSDLGGTASVKKTPFGAAVTTCTGGALDGTACVNTKKSTTCTTTLTNQPSSPLQDVVASPTGGIEEPTGGGAPGGGAGGIDPTWGVNSGPSDGGWVVLASHDSGKHDKAKQRGKHKPHGRDGKRGKH